MLIGFYCTGEPRYYRIVKTTPFRVFFQRCYARYVDARDDWVSKRVMHEGRVAVPVDITYGPVMFSAKRPYYVRCGGVECIPYQPDTDPYEYIERVSLAVRQEREQQEQVRKASAPSDVVKSPSSPPKARKRKGRAKRPSKKRAL